MMLFVVMMGGDICSDDLSSIDIKQRSMSVCVCVCVCLLVCPHENLENYSTDL